MDNQNHIEKLRQAVVAGDVEAASTTAQAAIDAGIDPATIIKQAINEPMGGVGQSFQDGDLFLPELIMIGDAASAASDMIVPHISAVALLRESSASAQVGMT